MKDLFQDFKDKNEILDDTYYIFLLPRFAETDQLGYMPRKRKFGFVNHEQLNAKEEEYVKTIAHELSHGAFVLHHTFVQHPQLVNNPTQNLLDNSKTGTILHKYQWDAVHNPSKAWVLFDEDEERGQVAEEADISFSTILYDGYPVIKYTGVQAAFSNITPSGNKYNLPKGAEATYYPRDGFWAGGSLAGFVIDGHTYWGWWNKTTTPKTFLGYAKRKLNDLGQRVMDGDFFPSDQGTSDSVYVAIVTGTCNVEWRGRTVDDFIFEQIENNFIITSHNLDNFYLSQEFLLPSSDCYTDIELCREKFAGSPWLSGDDPISRFIQENPCMIADLKRYRLYTDIPESDWIKGIKNITGGLLAFGFTPLVSPVLAELGVQNVGKKLVVDFGVGYTVDVMLQRTIHYYWPGEGNPDLTWQQTMDKVDHKGALISGAEATITLKNPSLEIGVQSAVSCLTSGWIEKGELLEEFDQKKCAIGIGSTLLFNGLMGVSKTGIKHLKELPADELLKGFDKIFGKGPATPGDGSPLPVSASFIPEINGKILYRIFKAINGKPLDKKAIKYLLGTSDEKADEVFSALSGPNGPNLQKALFDDGLFDNIRRADLSDIDRGKLVQDLVDNPIFANEIGEVLDDGARYGMIDNWKVLSNGKASLRNIRNINALDAFKKANHNVSDDVLQTTFDGLKSSRKQSFVNALESCADNNNLIASLNKSRLASVEEIKGALNKMRDYKKGKPQSGNLGYLEGNVSGATIDNNKFWKSVSKEEAQLETHIFDAIEATGSNGTWKRITDSEFRMLNDLAKKLGGSTGQVKESVTGSLKIVSENPYCASCQGVIQQFSNMFPNIEITLIDGVK